MSKLLVLPLFLLLSCVSENKDAPGAGESVGEIRAFEAKTSLEDNERLKIICRALANKESVINVLSSSSERYTFSYSDKGCQDSDLSASKDIPVKMEASGPRIIFRPILPGDYFGFDEVELFSKGVMKDLCNYGATLTSPIETQSNTALWWTTYTNSSDCNSGFGNMCVMLERGSSVEGGKYRLHTREWLKFQVMDGREGFFLERKLVSSASCKKGQNIIRKAILK